MITHLLLVKGKGKRIRYVFKVLLYIIIKLKYIKIEKANEGLHIVLLVN